MKVQYVIAHSRDWATIALHNFLLFFRALFVIGFAQMVLRLFFILLAVNAIAFVARADASEQQESFEKPDLWAIVEAGPARADDELEDELGELADLGARFLKWQFTRDSDQARYASDRVFSDHGVAMVDDGAALNLKWRF